MATTPETRAVIHCRLDKSGAGSSPAGRRPDRVMNQILGARVEAVEAEDAVAPVYLTGGFASAFAPRVADVCTREQSAQVFPIRQRESRERIPKSAPKGQMIRQ